MIEFSITMEKYTCKILKFIELFDKRIIRIYLEVFLANVYYKTININNTCLIMRINISIIQN